MNREQKQKLLSHWNADLYDQEETETQDAAFLLSLLGDSPKRILEIACGSGRILIPLAKAGHYVTGLDLDESMLEKIPLKTKGMDNLSWKKADVIVEDWGTGYDVVVIAANFLLNIVSDCIYQTAQQILIKKAAKALRPGGALFIDYGYTLNPEEWFECSDDRVVFEGTDSLGTTGKMLLTNNTFDKNTGTCRFLRRYELTDCKGQFFVVEEPEEKHFPRLEEIRAYLSKAGFSIQVEYGDYLRTPIGEDTDRAILWAKKK